MKFCALNIRLFLLGAVLLFLSCSSSRSPGKASQPADFECPSHAAEGLEVTCLTLREKKYIILHIDLKAARIKMLWRDSSGFPYLSLAAAYRQLGDGLLALTNAGIYGENHAPEGLHIEGGKTLNPLNLKSGGGNFYMRPNGVFYVSDTGAGIVESEKLGSLGAPVHEATQSGPLLVVDGEINPNFAPGSQSLYVRNGIGVKSANEVYIVISQEEVNFYDLATVFKEKLNCRNALYLDGCVSQVYLPARGVSIPEQRRCNKEFVGLLGVVKLK